MTIKQAKEFIEQTVLLYLKKDEYGEYRIPIQRQRPIFLLGAPGVGKTAIMEQVAQNLGVALVSYSMTHHTRQSALGLPFITHKKYGDEEFDISEYTMSEIIASIYETMEKSGIDEGILFLDEINCVSETLSPSMLQFLQYKTFGAHSVPKGWVVVTAGNPPEYNKSVREFDIVTMDRLKVLEVIPDYDAFKEYAKNKGLHNAILNFLELKREYFYKIETTVSGKSYVTARGWEDLSEILKLYEEENLKVGDELIGQYLRNEKIVREFAAFYDLYNKYKRDYDIEGILEGHPSEFAFEKIAKAAVDERLSLLSMLMDEILFSMRKCVEESTVLSTLTPLLKNAKEKATDAKALADVLSIQAQGQEKKLTSLKFANAQSDKMKKESREVIRFLKDASLEVLRSDVPNEAAFDVVKSIYNNRVMFSKKKCEDVSNKLSNLFAFVEKAFDDGNEMLILVSELTVNEYSSLFIGRFGSDEYKKHANELMVDTKTDLLMMQINSLDI